jgi:hypothetical protein
MCGDATFDGRRVGHEQTDPHLRIKRIEFSQNARQDEISNGRTGTHEQRTAHFTGHLADAGFHFIGQGEDFFGIRKNPLTRWRQRNIAVSPLEQPGVELLFQLLDLESNRRLRHEQRMQPFGFYIIMAAQFFSQALADKPSPC